MEKLSTYIQSLDFAYLKVYSGLRGDSFTAFSKQIEEEIARLEVLLPKARYMQQQKLNRKIEALKNQINIYNVRLINAQAITHPNAKELASLEKNDTRFPKLMNFLNREGRQEAISMCLPVYREAIAFFDKEDQINGILHLCFECHWIVNEEGNAFYYGTSDYPELENFLLNELII